MLLFHWPDSWPSISRQVTAAMQGGLDEASLECLLLLYEQSSCSGGELTGYTHSCSLCFQTSEKLKSFPAKERLCMQTLAILQLVGRHTVVHNSLRYHLSDMYSSTVWILLFHLLPSKCVNRLHLDVRRQKFWKTEQTLAVVDLTRQMSPQNVDVLWKASIGIIKYKPG